jgi:hypothetical protein
MMHCLRLWFASCAISAASCSPTSQSAPSRVPERPTSTAGRSGEESEDTLNGQIFGADAEGNEDLHLYLLDVGDRGTPAAGPQMYITVIGEGRMSPNKGSYELSMPQLAPDPSRDVVIAVWQGQGIGSAMLRPTLTNNMDGLAPGRDHRVDLTLERPSGELSLDIRTSTGNAVEDVYIRYAPVRDEWEWLHVIIGRDVEWPQMLLPLLSRLSGKSDRNGNVTFRGIVGHASDSESTDIIITASRDGYVVEDGVFLMDSDRVEYKLLAKSLEDVSVGGSVRDSNGRPIVGSTIEVCGGPTTSSNVMGLWRIQGGFHGVGPWRVLCSKPGMRSSEADVSERQLLESSDVSIEFALERAEQ